DGDPPGIHLHMIHQDRQRTARDRPEAEKQNSLVKSSHTLPSCRCVCLVTVREVKDTKPFSHLYEMLVKIARPDRPIEPARILIASRCIRVARIGQWASGHRD